MLACRECAMHISELAETAVLAREMAFAIDTSPHMTESSGGSRTSSSGTSGEGWVTEPSSLRTNCIVLILSICLLFGSEASSAVAEQDASPEDATNDGFHFPSSSAEQVLDLIVTLEDHKPGSLSWYAENVPWRDVRYDPHYARLITPSLREAISHEESRQVTENCGGKYVEGDNCSFGSDPITCAQDLSEDGYLFRTEKSGPNEAVVSLRWPGLPQTVGTYRLIRAGGVWKVDGIRCDPTMSFNMP